MITAKLIRSSLVVAFGLCVTSAALARRPPALAEAQRQASEAYSHCPESRIPETAGYRDMLVRARPHGLTPRVVLAAPAEPARAKGNHRVLVCDGTTIRPGSGYRDFPVRLQTEDRKLHVAGARELHLTP